MPIFVVHLGMTTLLKINNLREKFSPGPGFEPGSPAQRWRSNQLSHPDDPLAEARILLLLDLRGKKFHQNSYKC